MPAGFYSPRLAAQEKKADPATITIYVTKTGEKYRNDGCRSLRYPRSNVEGCGEALRAVRDRKPPIVK